MDNVKTCCKYTKPETNSKGNHKKPPLSFIMHIRVINSPWLKQSFYSSFSSFIITCTMFYVKSLLWKFAISARNISTDIKNWPNTIKSFTKTIEWKKYTCEGSKFFNYQFAHCIYFQSILSQLFLDQDHSHTLISNQ